MPRRHFSIQPFLLLCMGLLYFSFTPFFLQSCAFTSVNTASGCEGVNFSFTVTTDCDATIDTCSITESGTLPSGLSFVDYGNGTATLAGIPAPGSSTDSPYTLTFNLSGDGGATICTSQTFTLTINPACAQFTSPNSASVTFGSLLNISITTNASGGTLTMMGSIPGLSFTDDGDGKGVLSGTPTYQGDYSVLFNLNSPVCAQQTFTLTIAAPVAQASDATSQLANIFLHGTGVRAKTNSKMLGHLITWRTPRSKENPVVAYRLYADQDLQKLIAEIPARPGKHVFSHPHNQRSHKNLHFYIVSVGEFGNTSKPVRAKKQR